MLGGVSTPVLATKLYAPTRRPGAVPRPRLVERLAAGVQPEPSFADGLHVQRVLGAVERSSAERGVWTNVG